MVSTLSGRVKKCAPTSPYKKKRKHILKPLLGYITKCTSRWRAALHWPEPLTNGTFIHFSRPKTWCAKRQLTTWDLVSALRKWRSKVKFPCLLQYRSSETPRPRPNIKNDLNFYNFKRQFTSNSIWRKTLWTSVNGTFDD